MTYYTKHLSKQSLIGIASYPGQTCAAFLRQHKRVLGIKHITHIKLFCGKPFKTPKGIQLLPQLLFTVGDVPTNDIKPDPLPGWVAPPHRPTPSLPGPPPTPQPVIPGPSTPRAVAPLPPSQQWPRALVAKVSYHVEIDFMNNNTIRTHVFHAASNN
jgi:hypothetical protein